MKAYGYYHGIVVNYSIGYVGCVCVCVCKNCILINNFVRVILLLCSTLSIRLTHSKPMFDKIIQL